MLGIAPRIKSQKPARRTFVGGLSLAAGEGGGGASASQGISWNTTSSVAQFGDVVSPSASKFGEVVSMKRPTSISENEYLVPKFPVAGAQQQQAKDDDDGIAAAIRESKRRNVGVAIVSIILAISSYLWDFTHPVTPVQLLFTMQQNSQPVSIIGVNQKPTVVDFWAPWCENCKLTAPTLLQVEEEYKGRVNFVMVNGDKNEAWPYIEAFGVDAIPHMALVSADGDVETALIGLVPKHVLEADLDVLLANAKNKNNNQQEQQQSLPYRMLDVFASNPAGRRVHFQ